MVVYVANHNNANYVPTKPKTSKHGNNINKPVKMKVMASDIQNIAVQLNRYKITIKHYLKHLFVKTTKYEIKIYHKVKICVISGATP